MIRWARQAGVLLLALSLGCATAPARMNLTPSWLKSSRTGEKESEQLRKSAEQNAEEEEREPLIAQTESAETKVQHDPATRMLIEAELRDASPEDRQEWLALLAAVDSSQVPYVLQKRRFKNGDKPSEIVAAAASTSETLQSKHEIARASHSTSDESPSQTEMPSGITATPITEQESAASPKSVATESSSSGWPQRIRSLADPTRIWSHPGDGGMDHPNPEKGPSDKQERSTFGLPLVIGTQAKADAAVAEFHARETPPVLPLNPAPPTMSVKTPRLTPGSQLWEDELQKLISLLEAEVSVQSGGNGDRDQIRKQVALRMLYLIEDQPQKAQLTIPGIPPNEQEFWTELFMGLSEHLDRSGTVDPGERATQTMALLKSAAFRLQDQARLRLPNLAFCQTINGFGNYEGYPTDQFSPGQTVLVYAEIRNFVSQPTGESDYRTRIRSTIEIYTGGDAQQLVDRSTFEATEDRCRSLRTDYYHSYRIGLPAHLARGPHLLKLIIQDELSGKIATESLPFTIQ